jgi:hypothetical protein
MEQRPKEKFQLLHVPLWLGCDVDSVACAKLIAHYHEKGSREGVKTNRVVRVAINGKGSNPSFYKRLVG